MAKKTGRRSLPKGPTAAPMAKPNTELAEAFSAAVLDLVEHNCSCPSARFVRLLIKYRKDIFKGGEVVGQGDYNPAD